MEYKTLSDNPIIVDFWDDFIEFKFDYKVYEKNNNKLEVVTKNEKILLTTDELEQIYQFYKEYKKKF